MGKIVWKKVEITSVDGKIELFDPPLWYKGEEMLQQILSMPQTKKEIDFTMACNLFLDEIGRRSSIYPASEVRNFWDNFISWISSQGCYIKLKGNEYTKTHRPS